MAPHVFLINLDRSTDRLARCTTILNGLGLTWERVSAVEGAQLDPGYLHSLNPNPAPHGEWFRPLTAGEIGCFLSHIKCWRLIADRELDCALILEDDFTTIGEHVPERLRLLSTSCKQWDALKLTRLRKNAKLVHTLAPGIELRFGGKGPEDCTGYMVSHQGALKLIQQRNTLLRPVDFDLKHYWERDLTILSASPNLFHQASHEEAASVIGDRTQYRRYPTWQKVQVYLRKYRYHIKFWLANQLGFGRNQARDQSFHSSL